MPAIGGRWLAVRVMTFPLGCVDDPPTCRECSAVSACTGRRTIDQVEQGQGLAAGMLRPRRAACWRKVQTSILAARARLWMVWGWPPVGLLEGCVWPPAEGLARSDAVTSKGFLRDGTVSGAGGSHRGRDQIATRTGGQASAQGDRPSRNADVLRKIRSHVRLPVMVRISTGHRESVAGVAGSSPAGGTGLLVAASAPPTSEISPAFPALSCPCGGCRAARCRGIRRPVPRV
jgi:hypothetical protein